MKKSNMNRKKKKTDKTQLVFNKSLLVEVCKKNNFFQNDLPFFRKNIFGKEKVSITYPSNR